MIDNKKTRNYSSILYTESMKENFIEIMENECVQAFISPLHDKDVNEDGEIKKAHYHVMIMYDNTKTVQQAKEYFDKIGGVGCEKIASTRGYARYLIHADNPNKYQYDRSDVISLCGAEYDLITSCSMDKYQAIGQMMDFCESNNVISYSDLLMYARSNDFNWFRVLCDSGTIVIKEYLKSRAWTINKKV